MATKKTNLTSERCLYFAGPYKGYCGHAEYDAEGRVFHGRVIGTKDVITFEADDVRKAHQAFVDSIEDYLAFCAERKEKPEKPYSGKFVARIEPELHRTLSMIAESTGRSLNSLVSESLESIAKAALAGGTMGLAKLGRGGIASGKSSANTTAVPPAGRIARRTKKRPTKATLARPSNRRSASKKPAK
jgi:predicted HicB family RNase H-like nuclease